MFYKILAKIFYWYFLRKTTWEMYEVVDSKGTREPTEIGRSFYSVYHYFRAKGNFKKEKN